MTHYLTISFFLDYSWIGISLLQYFWELKRYGYTF